MKRSAGRTEWTAAADKNAARRVMNLVMFFRGGTAARGCGDEGGHEGECSKGDEEREGRAAAGGKATPSVSKT